MFYWCLLLENISDLKKKLHFLSLHFFGTPIHLLCFKLPCLLNVNIYCQVIKIHLWVAKTQVIYQR